MAQQRVLVLSDYYWPGFRAGGPTPALRNLADRLGDQLSIRVVTRDRDFGASGPYPELAAGWTMAGKESVRYLAPNETRFWPVVRLLRGLEFDVLYLNSMFSWRFTVQVLVARRLGLLPGSRVVLAPRGELSRAALSHHAGRKARYLGVFRGAGLGHGVVWQATGEHEAEDIRRQFPDASIVLAPDIPRDVSPADRRRAPKAPGAARIAFLARISPIKNLDGALRTLARVTGRVEIDVYGPLEDRRYWVECESLASALPHNITFRHAGEVDPSAVVKTLADYDLFFLPTRSENFGHAILEALQAGCPVLISDQTRWSDVVASGAGWAIPVEAVDQFAQRIDEVCQMGPSEHTRRAAAARAYAEAFVADGETVEASRRMLEGRPATSLRSMAPKVLPTRKVG